MLRNVGGFGLGAGTNDIDVGIKGDPDSFVMTFFMIYIFYNKINLPQRKVLTTTLGICFGNLLTSSAANYREHL